MGNSESDQSNAAGSSNEVSEPRKNDMVKVVAAVGVGALAAWGLAKLVSSSGLEGKIPTGSGDNTPRLKMNTDGSVTNSQAGLGGRAGFGGVIRDAESGSWIMGFYGKLDNCSICEAELWGIYHGLKIIQDHDFGEVEIESDNESAVKLINGENDTRLEINKIVDNCKVMLQRTGCTLKHIGNKGNKVADEMAKRGRDQDNELVTFSSPPDQKIERLLVVDAASATSV
jgi:ribonuclease HI